MKKSSSEWVMGSVINVCRLNKTLSSQKEKLQVQLQQTSSKTEQE